MENTPNKFPPLRGLILWRSAAALLLALDAALLVSANSFIAGGADSSGYANAARLFSRGRLVERIEILDRLGLPSEWGRMFIPLGYAPAARPRSMAPAYPPGLPLQMTAAAVLGGWARAPFLVGPASAVASLVLLYLLGRELGLPRTLSASATLLLALSPIFFGMAVQPMSDVPATAWVLATLFFGVLARRDERWAILCGAAFGMAVLVRATDILIGPAVALALPAKPKTITRAALAAAPFAAFLLLYNTAAFGSPTATGYGSMLSWSLSPRNVLPEIRNYAHWIPVLLTPLLPLSWLAVGADRRAKPRDRGLLLLWFGGFLAFYCFYQLYEDWWSARFLLPGIPALILAAMIVARDLPFAFRSWNLFARVVRWQTPIGFALLLGIGAVEIHHIRRFDLLRMARGEAIYRDASLWAASALPAGSLVAAMQMSGALKYYTDVPTVRWDAIEPGRFQARRATLEARGLRWYALLWPFEETDFARKLPGNWRKIGTRRDVALWRLE